MIFNSLLRLFMCISVCVYLCVFVCVFVWGAMRVFVQILSVDSMLVSLYSYHYYLSLSHRVSVRHRQNTGLCRLHPGQSTSTGIFFGKYSMQLSIHSIQIHSHIYFIIDSYDDVYVCGLPIFRLYLRVYALCI